MADFRLHCKKVDAKIWEERFGVYGAWKRSTFNEYKRTGYIELKTGFRCLGPLKYTEAINLHVQGSSAHLLFWTLLKTAPLIRGISGRSNIVCTIHDAVVIDAHPDEVDAVVRMVLDYGTQKVREHWPWITMPLRMEAEVSEVDGSWAKMKPYHLEEQG
jgi:DNA polymerase I-like protein with 3'-5' exonuclease and polymerase domains